MLPSLYEKQDCSLARALEVVGERWTLLIMRDAFYGVRRFNDFSAHLDAPRTVLSTRLRTLVDAGLLERDPDPEHAGRYLYELTGEGRSLWPALYALRSWGERHAGRSVQPRRVFVHDECGERLDDSARCPVCEVLPQPEHVIVKPLGRPGPGARTDPVARGLLQPHRLLDVLPVPAPARLGAEVTDSQDGNTVNPPAASLVAPKQTQ
jgi:DNA-binding HxlR family transcriptional regulator